MKIENVYAYILTGGRSERMGENKAFLTLDNQTFIDIIYRKLSTLFQEVFVITKKEYKDLYKGFKVVCDVREEQSPIIGILTALSHSKKEYVFIKSCDNPLFSEELIKRMTDLAFGYDVVVPYLSDGLHPLFAIYSRKSIEVIKSQLEMKNFKIIDFFDHLKVYLIKEEEVKRYDVKLISFLNINTREDYESLKRNCL